MVLEVEPSDALSLSYFPAILILWQGFSKLPLLVLNCDPPASAPWITGIIDVCHHVWQIISIFKKHFYLDVKELCLGHCEQRDTDEGNSRIAFKDASLAKQNQPWKIIGKTAT